MEKGPQVGQAFKCPVYEYKLLQSCNLMMIIIDYAKDNYKLYFLKSINVQY